MSIKRITAILPIELMASIEEQLRSVGVPGVTVEKVHGYGEHPNYFRRDLMQNNVRLVLYTSDDRVDDILSAISECARDSGIRSGVIAVESIDRLVHLFGGAEVDPDLLSD